MRPCSHYKVKLFVASRIVYWIMAFAHTYDEYLRTLFISDSTWETGLFSVICDNTILFNLENMQKQHRIIKKKIYFEQEKQTKWAQKKKIFQRFIKIQLIWLMHLWTFKWNSSKVVKRKSVAGYDLQWTLSQFLIINPKKLSNLQPCTTHYIFSENVCFNLLLFSSVFLKECSAQYS